jgi:soluble lytic murein transglycosylase
VVLRRRGASARHRSRAAAQRAETLFRLRRYADAASAYAALPPRIDARIGWARSLARSGDPLRGARELAALADRNRGEAAERARWLAALLYAGEGDEARARPLFETLARFGRSEYAREARWQLAWSEFAAGRDARAAKDFRRVAAENSDPLDALRARYWRARALEREGSAEALALFAELARDYPLSYYGWRAGLRLAASAGADLGERAAAPRDAAAGQARLPESELARARILLEGGYGERVRELLPQLASRARSLEDRLRLAQLATDADAYHAAQTLIVDAYAERLAAGPAGDLLELWWHAWPAPHADWVRGSVIAETARGLPAELVYAIMREESGYRPAVVSISGARGLLQLMPETARRVAEQVALPGFRDDDLFEPRVNIRLGAAYIAELLQRFDGRLSAAIASYNAGPEAVSRWLAEAPAEDDVWVESIPYDQTRAYVKRVLRSMHAYRVLY